MFTPALTILFYLFLQYLPKKAFYFRALFPFGIFDFYLSTTFCKLKERELSCIACLQEAVYSPFRTELLQKIMIITPQTIRTKGNQPNFQRLSLILTARLIFFRASILDSPTLKLKNFDFRVFRSGIR